VADSKPAAAAQAAALLLFVFPEPESHIDALSESNSSGVSSPLRTGAAAAEGVWWCPPAAAPLDDALLDDAAPRCGRGCGCSRLFFFCC
jgi:hypothetical protein